LPTRFSRGYNGWKTTDTLYEDVQRLRLKYKDGFLRILAKDIQSVNCSA